jgi:hypothetical protein
MALLLSSNALSRIPKVLSAARNNFYFTYSNQIAQPIPNKTPKFCEAAEAVKCIKSGNDE